VKRQYITLLWFLFIGLLAANTHTLQRPIRKTEKHPIQLMSYPARADSATGFDVQKYTINISISQDPAYISGNVLAEVQAEENLSSITYQLVGLDVSSVLVNGELAPHTHQNGEIQIPLDVSAGESFETQIFYSGNPQLSGDFYNVGMYIRPEEVFTISDPDAGRYWWPCYDHPWDKAIVDIIVTMRSDWKVAANGLRESIVDNGDGTATTTWRGSHPMTTYLVCITASLYQEIYQNALQGNLPIINFVTQSQYQNAISDFASLPDMIDYYSALFGDYPFEKYGMTAVNMSTFGAMEHQTMTTLGNYIIDGLGTYELTIAHELVHQWYGDAVSFLTFADVWLSEGFATYGELLWVDQVQGWQAATEYVRDSYHQYYLNWENTTTPPTIYNPPFNNYFYPQSYEKAASVLHMLRLKMGDDDFFELLRQWFATYKGSNTITQEFQDMAQDISGLDLQQFFEQWIYGSGIPSVSYSLWYHPENQSLKISAKSSSPTTTEFDLDIPFKINYAADSDSLLIRATPQGFENIFPFTQDPIGHQANHNYWCFLRNINEEKPELKEAIASSAKVYLIWDEYQNAEGYQIQRRSASEEPWQIINTELILGTSFIDRDLQNGLEYQYRIQAVDASGYISAPSQMQSAIPQAFSFEHDLLLVDETRDGNGAMISPDDMMVDSFYESTISPIAFDSWDIAQEGIPDLATLGQYKSILWHDDDFAQNEIGSAEDILLGYLLGEGHILISGWKTASSLSSEFLELMAPGTDVYYDNSPVLNGAIGQGYNDLDVDGTKLAQVWNNMLPYVSSFEGGEQSIYLADAASSSNAAGRSVGLRSGNLVILGFPLYFMQESEVRDFLQQILPEMGAVSLADDHVPALPLNLDTYPNPFNPYTTISYSLPKAGKISLRLYNLKGQLLRELAEGVYSAGHHTQSLDASELPSGIYFLRLSNERETITRKITLVK